jgi:hypothetical protein
MLFVVLRLKQNIFIVIVVARYGQPWFRLHANSSVGGENWEARG